jgi:hypothetical protein
MRVRDLFTPAVAPTPPGDAGFAAFSLALALAVAVIARFEFVPLLDHVNLAFHEVGHLVFAPFGAVLHYLGGTLAQFVFPTLAALSFWRRGLALAAAACGVWWCENLRYTAVYMADARAQALPLVGGGEHDWTWLFSYFGVIEHDTAIAGAFEALCWLGIAAIWLAVAAWWWRARAAGDADARHARRAEIIEAARRRALERRERGG